MLETDILECPDKKDEGVFMMHAQTLCTEELAKGLHHSD